MHFFPTKKPNEMVSREGDGVNVASAVPRGGILQREKAVFFSHLPFISDWQFHQIGPCHLRRLKVKPDKADVRASAVDGPDFFFKRAIIIGLSVTRTD